VVAATDLGANHRSRHALPILLIYLFLQRYVVDAFVRSGLK
jgi:ABC-type maltose transport system permease subunit